MDNVAHRSWFVLGVLALGFGSPSSAKAKVVEYDLTIATKTATIGGKSAEGITINGTSPGPVLHFREGDTARIRVRNEMDEPTSIHWHGLLLPNNMDGVPFLTYLPIAPRTTFTYEFPLRQSGTYWYHSHTEFQEQSGVYGAIVIAPAGQAAPPQAEKTIVLSDWTTESPMSIMRMLKRGSDWYSLVRGSAQSLLGAVRAGHLKDCLERELIRMPPMDISDVAYDYFLANGAPELSIPAKPGETIKLRLVDGASMTFFHLEFAGGPMMIVAADGQDVQPLPQQRFLMAVAETYDVLVKVPASGAYELRATAQDGSGHASIWIGTGERHPAPDVPRPDVYALAMPPTLKTVFALTPAGTMGMSDAAVRSGRFDHPGMMGMGSMDGMQGTKGMQGMKGMEGMSGMAGMDMSGMKPMSRPAPSAESPSKPRVQTYYTCPMGHPIHSERPGRCPICGMTLVKVTREAEGAPAPTPQTAAPAETPAPNQSFAWNFRPLAADASRSKDVALDGVDPRRPWPPYSQLRSVRPTTYAVKGPVRVVRLTLDEDMERYVWTINGKTLSESDSIRVRRGELTRFILINRTMMHHPMHLHGHFFRVLNGQGDYSPLKHTVDVPPMSTTVIEFLPDAQGDWFFHCHFLYHMMSGMARVVHYEGFHPAPEVAAARHLLHPDEWYAFGHADVLSNMTQGFATAENTRNSLDLEWELGWRKGEESQWESIFLYDRYVNRFLGFFAGADVLREEHHTSQQTAQRGVFGLHYLLPMSLGARAWVDSDGGGRFALGRAVGLTPRLSLYGEGEYDTHESWEAHVGLDYTLTRSFSLVGQWQSRYGWGAGVQGRF